MKCCIFNLTDYISDEIFDAKQKVKLELNIQIVLYRVEDYGKR